MNLFKNLLSSNCIITDVQCPGIFHAKNFAYICMCVCYSCGALEGVCGVSHPNHFSESFFYIQNSVHILYVQVTNHPLPLSADPIDPPLHPHTQLCALLYTMTKNWSRRVSGNNLQFPM